ncbi:Transmembrane protein 181 [Galemys pyrenaicus]|uniref:Transmembrane protein 181 n=1 Tax=Galemys pyrenaicus TaxID=202257 RepID=A0A8J6DVP7_GALPY|nr:Transmembrane protein 181 [Galemys pyrenaicus]
MGLWAPEGAAWSVVTSGDGGACGGEAARPRSSAPRFQGMKVFFTVVAAVYVLYLLFLVVQACSELRHMPYVGEPPPAPREGPPRGRLCGRAVPPAAGAAAGQHGAGHLASAWAAPQEAWGGGLRWSGPQRPLGRPGPCRTNGTWAGRAPLGLAGPSRGCPWPHLAGDYPGPGLLRPVLHTRDLRLKFLTALTFVVLVIRGREPSSGCACRGGVAGGRCSLEDRGAGAASAATCPLLPSIVILYLRFGAQVLQDNFVAELSAHYQNYILHLRWPGAGWSVAAGRRALGGGPEAPLRSGPEAPLSSSAVRAGHVPMSVTGGRDRQLIQGPGVCTPPFSFVGGCGGTESQSQPQAVPEH